MNTKIVVAGVMVSGIDRSRNAAQSASTAAHQSASPAVATKPRRGSTGACWSSKAFHAASRSERSRSSVSPVGTIDPDVSGKQDHVADDQHARRTDHSRDPHPETSASHNERKEVGGDDDGDQVGSPAQVDEEASKTDGDDE